MGHLGGCGGGGGGGGGAAAAGGGAAAAAGAAAAIQFFRLNTNTAESPLAPRSTCNNGLVNTFTSLCNHTSLTEYGTVDEGT